MIGERELYFDYLRRFDGVMVSKYGKEERDRAGQRTRKGRQGDELFEKSFRKRLCVCV